MSQLVSYTQLSDVTCIIRPGIGPVYRAVLNLWDLYLALKHSRVRYAPKYQRGFKPSVLDEMSDHDFDQLLPLNHPLLQLDHNRARAIAVKFLQGRLYNSDIIWNARSEPGEPEPLYDAERRTLAIATDTTVPDSGHRHLAYFLIGQWMESPQEIPVEVNVDDTTITEDEIRRLLRERDLRTTQVYVTIFQLNKQREGHLYDEFNSDAKPPSTAVALDLNPEKTPSRRFIYRLMDKSAIFARDQIETRRNTIGSKSRKLTTNATMESAVRPMTRRLVQLEKDPDRYNDLLDFVDEFFVEWAQHFPAFRPEATADQRWELRNQSFALSNIMFFPLFRLAFDLWEQWGKKGLDWRVDRQWVQTIRRIADPDVMSRDNTEWHGKILIQTFDQQGKPTGWVASSTRQTRDAAYRYLCQVAGLDLTPEPGKAKNGQVAATKTPVGTTA